MSVIVIKPETDTKVKSLSASRIGFPCDRNLWYAANGYPEEVDRKTKRIFAVGHALEALVVRFMREDGFTVFHNDKTHDDPEDFAIQLEGGILTGRHDILFHHPQQDGLILGDIKTMNRQAYAFWRRKGTLEKYPQYVKQLTVYYKGLQSIPQIGPNLNGTLAIVGFCKDDSRYSIDYFPYQEELWEEIKERCERIFASNDPIDPGKIPAWACNYCGYRHICDARPEKMQEESIEVVNDQDIELAAYMLAEARSLKAQANELEKEAKAVLEKLKDREEVRAGSYIIRIRPYRQAKLDTKALREKAPEIYNAYLREVVGVRYEVQEVL